MKKIVLLACILIVIGCQKDDDNTLSEIEIDASEFQEIKEGEMNYFADLQQEVSFLAMAIKTESNEFLFFQKYGSCAAQQVEDCFDLDNLDPESGFSACKGFYGNNCYDFLVAVRDGQTEVINDIAEFRDLVGDIDKLGEAIFVLNSQSYHVGVGNIETGAYRKVNDGHEFIATKIISDCLPIIIHRYHLKVTHKGEIKILGEEESYRSENSCI